METDIINKNLIAFDMIGSDKEQIIGQLARLIEREDRLSGFEAYLQDVLEREELTTTGIGFGLAVPHGKSEAVKTPAVAFGRLRQGVEWNSLDGEPVQMVFLLAVPREAVSNIHLKLLSSLARKFMDEEFRHQLMVVEKEDVVLELLGDVFKQVVL